VFYHAAVGLSAFDHVNLFTCYTQYFILIEQMYDDGGDNDDDE